MPQAAPEHSRAGVEALLARADGSVRTLDLIQQEHWRNDRPERPLRAFVARTDAGARLVLTDRIEQAENARRAGADLAGIAAEVDAPLIDPDGALPLEPLTVPKPWGRELWYTGIEARGVCRVRAAQRTGTGTTPLPWLLTALPQRFAGIDAPVLLKILAPHPDTVLGDLYFEMHERKQEVYVVTGVDPVAWPEGRGAIRMGFDPELVRRRGEDGVRQDFAEAVAAYEPVRRRIDARLDACRDQAGVARDAVVAPETLRAWEAELPAELVEEERRLRAAVEALTHSEPLMVGDVVRVPSRVPHALQHGVRVVEFQTPVYERRILYFGQKVLTQDRWDTREALPRMRLRPPEPEPLPRLVDTGEVRAEWVVRFEDFRVLRVRLAAGASVELPRAGHGVVMGVEGTVQIAGTDLGPEAAALVPGPALAASVQAPDGDALCLVALPTAEADP